MTTTATNNVPLHAHWDCSKGASSSSMLTATFDAWRALRSGNNGAEQEEEDKMDEMLQHLNDMLGQVLPSNLKNAGCKIAILQESSSTLAFTIFLNNDKQQQYANNLSNLLNQCHLPPSVKQKANKIEWNQLMTMTKEDDALASFLSILTVLLLLDDLKIESVSCSPLPTLDLDTDMLRSLIGMPTNPNGMGRVTPLAVALLRCCCVQEEAVHPEIPALMLLAVGVGSNNVRDNTKELDTTSSETRLLVGNRISRQQQSGDVLAKQNDPWKVDTLVHMEANLDDITAEALAFAVETLLQKGAIDAWTAPIVMKKGRSAHTLHCLCHDEAATRTSLLRLIFQHTTTLGIRIHRDLQRVALRRSFVTVQTPYTNTTREGRVSVKVGYLDDNQVVSMKAEFDHCREISIESGVPIQQIAASALENARVDFLEQEKDHANILACQLENANR